MRAADLPFFIALHSKFTIAARPFTATFVKRESAMLLAASWEDATNPVDLCVLTQELHFNLSPVKDWKIELSKAQISFIVGQETHHIDFKLVSPRYGNLEIEAQSNGFVLNLEPEKQEAHFDCCSLPLLGHYFQKGDSLELRRVSIDFDGAALHGDANACLTLFGKVVFDSAKSENVLLAQTQTKWFTINKSIGPVTLYRLGFTVQGQFINLLFDTSFCIGPIVLETLGLTLGIPMDLDFHKTTYSIEGISVDYTSGPLHLGGGLVHTKGKSDSYDGILQLNLPGVSMSALASYTVVEGEASLFVYAYLGFADGGLPSFEITGFSAGMGTNRQLVIPELEQVESFPLVDMALHNCPVKSTGEMLRSMDTYLLTAKDSYFGAAGISFRAFGLIDGFALAVLSFGKDFEAALLGRCQAQIPQNGKAPLVRLELPFLIRVVPAQGFFDAEAILDSGSFLFDPDCHLTGKFAFFLWFGGPHKGDFVITVGGYHPRYTPPAHYPSADRLGISWQIDSHLILKGNVYFALTPAAIMAGGALSLTFQSGNLRAWVTAQADFLVQWAPVHYDIEIGVSVGASYRVDVLFIHHTFSIEIGASLLLQGPPFYGKAHIKWCIISFTISFGRPSNAPPALTWENFRQSFLPQPAPEFIPQSGFEQLEGTNKWIVTSSSFTLQLRCKVPVTALCVGGQIVPIASPPLGILPMGEKKLDAPVTITYSKDGDETQQPIQIQLQVTPQAEDVPESLWATSNPDAFSSGLISGAITQLLITSPDISPSHGTSPYLVSSLLADEPVEKRKVLETAVTTIDGPTYPQQDALSYVKHIADDEICNKRNRLLQTLQKEGFSFAPCEVKTLAHNPQQNLRCPPTLGSIGAKEETQ